MTNKNKRECGIQENAKSCPDVKQHAVMYRNATNVYLAKSDENQIKAHMTHMHTADRQTDRLVDEGKPRSIQELRNTKQNTEFD